MKINIASQQWRLRVDEAELATLLDGNSLQVVSELPGGRLVFELGLADVDQLAISGIPDGWWIILPAADVRAFRERLPSKDGIEFALVATDFSVEFQVDVRDSLKQRRHSA